MCECMMFPDNVEEFMDSYKIVDTEHVYTNGTEMVPIFRMKQWFEHRPERKTGRWIPCSERLPGKHGEMYLVTISDGAIYSAALQWDINRKRWYLSFLNNEEILIDYIDDVIAWQPLPEPYREGEE